MGDFLGRDHYMKQTRLTLLLTFVAALGLLAQDQKYNAPIGIKDPGVRRPITNIHPDAVFQVPGKPDWVLLFADSVWIGNNPNNTISRLDPKANKVVSTIHVGKTPCAGLAGGFGSVWVPICGDKTRVRVDVSTNKVVATIPIGPADTEGTIVAGGDSIWYLTDPKGVLSRIDPATNKAIATITVPAGSFAAAYGDGAVWVTSTLGNTLTKVNPKTNVTTTTIKVGPKPRFIAYGEGAVWTLNQGDGSVTRVDPKTNKVVATIETGVPGLGGDIAAGEGSVWVTIKDFPLMRIDVKTNKVVQQWTGPGGVSIRAGMGSLWLTNQNEGNVWRINPKQP
jgi:virginiamycin B lyase